MQINDENATVIHFTNETRSIDLMVDPFCTRQDADAFVATTTPEGSTDAAVLALTDAAGAAISWLSVFSATSLIKRLDMLLGRDESDDLEDTCWIVDIAADESRHIVGFFDGMSAAWDFANDRAAKVRALGGHDHHNLVACVRPVLRTDLTPQPGVLASNVERFTALAALASDAVATA